MIKLVVNRGEVKDEEVMGRQSAGCTKYSKGTHTQVAGLLPGIQRQIIYLLEHQSRTLASDMHGLKIHVGLPALARITHP